MPFTEDKTALTGGSTTSVTPAVLNVAYRVKFARSIGAVTIQAQGNPIRVSRTGVAGVALTDYIQILASAEVRIDMDNPASTSVAPVLFVESNNAGAKAAMDLRR